MKVNYTKRKKTASKEGFKNLRHRGVIVKKFLSLFRNVNIIGVTTAREENLYLESNPNVPHLRPSGQGVHSSVWTDSFFALALLL